MKQENKTPNEEFVTTIEFSQIGRFKYKQIKMK